MEYLEFMRKKEPIRPSELEPKFGTVRYDLIEELANEHQIGRKKYGDEYTLLFMPEHEILAEERYKRDVSKNVWLLSKRHKEDVNKIEKAIAKLIDELNRIPTIKEMGVELEKDPKKYEMIHSLIFERLARIIKLKPSVEGIIQSVYKEKTKLKKTIGHKGKPIRRSTHEFLEKATKEIESSLPSDEIIMDKLLLDELERRNSAIHSLIWLCKKEFRDKQIIVS